MGVAFAIRALDVHNGDVRAERRHHHHILAAVGVPDAPVERVGFFQVQGAGLVHGHERQPAGSGLQTADHAEVGVFLPLQAALFHPLAQPLERADARVAGVRKDDLAGAARGNHLVINQVGRGARQDEVFYLLADNFVPGGKGDEVRKAGSIHQVPRVHVLANGIAQTAQFGHANPSRFQSRICVCAFPPRAGREQASFWAAYHRGGRAAG